MKDLMGPDSIMKPLSEISITSPSSTSPLNGRNTSALKLTLYITSPLVSYILPSEISSLLNLHTLSLLPPTNFVSILAHGYLHRNLNDVAVLARACTHSGIFNPIGHNYFINNWLYFLLILYSRFLPSSQGSRRTTLVMFTRKNILSDFELS